MDGSQFDTLLRGVTTARSRRSAVPVMLRGALGLLGLSETQDKHHKKNHKRGGTPPAPPPPSPPSPPPPNPCQGQPDRTVCGVGQYCFGGGCGAPPTCP